MSIRYDYEPAGAGHSPMNTAIQQNDTQTAARGLVAAHVPDNKPFSTSPETAFPTAGDTKKSYCVSPDGRSKTWTAVGQDASGPRHPFLKRTFQFTSADGVTTIKTTEIHWTIAPSKDGKTRSVRYETTQDDRLYDRSGRELVPHRKSSFKGSFENDGKPLPFEEPLRDAWRCDARRPDDDQAAARDHRRRAWRKN
ncbi:MAG TPA: hypothetical protein VME63_06195 [Dyella sp.]|uniref:hypothetical protein n=1 Tax=Dyella sp. TaxID=1869338 RepID=UPI002C14EE42|nr:hypothetical protein [Dyella sp.]HTV84974.1 hypothetical protein [Dyella sp.]